MRQRRAEDKEEEAELTQPVLTGGLRARTVSKPSESLQDGCGPLVRHNYRHTHTAVCAQNGNTRRSRHRGCASDWRAGGSRKRDALPALSHSSTERKNKDGSRSQAVTTHRGATAAVSPSKQPDYEIITPLTWQQTLWLRKT